GPAGARAVAGRAAGWRCPHRATTAAAGCDRKLGLADAHAADGRLSVHPALPRLPPRSARLPAAREFSCVAADGHPPAVSGAAAWRAPARSAAQWVRGRRELAGVED